MRGELLSRLGRVAEARVELAAALRPCGNERERGVLQRKLAGLAISEANEIISTGRVSRAYVGFQATPVAANAATVNGTAEGLLAAGIDPGGPAQAAGLATGDVITSVNGQPAVSTDQIVRLTLTKRPGDEITVDYTRNGAARSATLTLASQP